MLSRQATKPLLDILWVTLKQRQPYCNLKSKGVQLWSFIGSLKGILSWDWGGLLIVLLDRYSTIDIAGKYLFLIIKPSWHINFNIFMHWGRTCPSSSVANSFWRLSTRSTKSFCSWRKNSDPHKIYSAVNMFCDRNFDPLATLPTRP
jgi:hypothetical protein